VYVLRICASAPAVVDGAVYIGSNNGTVHTFDALSGEPMWKYQTGGAVSSSPAVAYGTVFVGSNDHFVDALDARTGALE
jgi:outer membrane protein assembly factor BamB